MADNMAAMFEVRLAKDFLVYVNYILYNVMCRNSVCNVKIVIFC